MTTHKYGVEIPTSIANAKRLDELNGSTLWIDPLTKKMANVSVAFHILEQG